jgi:hypothetical protein
MLHVSEADHRREETPQVVAVTWNITLRYYAQRSGGTRPAVRTVAPNN